MASLLINESERSDVLELTPGGSQSSACISSNSTFRKITLTAQNQP